MGHPRPSSPLSRSPKGSVPAFKLHPSAINNDSKAQHILGLSRTELQSARTHSLKSKASLQSISPSETSSTRNPFKWRRGRLAGSTTNEAKLPSPPSAYKYKAPQSSDGAGISQVSSLYRQSSTSTLRSVHNTTVPPSRDTDQSFSPSDVDFTTRETHSTLQTCLNDTMETHRPRKLTKPPKSRGSTRESSLDQGRPYQGSDVEWSSASRKSSISNPVSKSPRTAKATTLHNTPPTLDQQQSSIPPNFFQRDAFRRRAVRDDRSVVNETNTNTTINRPFAKLNVRRPKTGTKHWFDDVEGVSSEEEENEEPQMNQKFVIQVERGFQNGRIRNASVEEADHSQEVHPKSLSLLVTEITGSPVENVAPVSEVQPEVTAPRSGDSLDHTRPKNNPLDQADLSSESILHLSETEDEIVDEEEGHDVLWPLQPVQSFESGAGIRKSLIINSCEESDFEIGFAHAVRATGNNTSGDRPSPIRIVHSKGSSSSSSPVDTPASRVAFEVTPGHSRSVSFEEAYAKDADEDALMDSFPATPVSTARSRRISARSSISIPDDRSVVSMKLMKVTRQEENLIAAMRKKRAAMKRAERAALHYENEVTQDIDGGDFLSRSRQQSLEFSARFDDGIDEREKIEAKVSGLGLSLYNHEASQQGSQSVGLTPVAACHAEVAEKRRPAKPMKLHLYPAPSLSTPYEKRGSRYIAQDDSHVAPPTGPYSQQTFIERPFGGWERINSTTVH